MKFKYKRYSQNLLRPVIPIKIKNKEIAVGYEVLVDSGADICIFNADIGKAIGIDVEKGKKQEVFGIGGKASIYFMHKDVEIEVGGNTYVIDAGFMPDVAGRTMSYGVVGQRGFFDIFVVKFDLKKEVIELKERS